MAAVSRILERLDRDGLRRTSQRSAVLEAALRRERPFTAQELVSELARAGIGRATVFRTLDHLVRVGALSRIHAIERGARCFRYTPCVPERHHHHLVCRVCGRVEEVATALLDEQLEAVARSRGYRALGHNVEIAGICPRCRA